MLQQTTVGAVYRRYDAFLRRFPDLACLARAREDSVLAAWSGLGYYARARNLHRAAREMVRRHGGRIPRDPVALSALPGFGEYMAAAVASLAFGARLPAADANVTRVLSRLFAIDGEPASRRHRESVRRHAATLLPRRYPGDLTAALMDLGQLVCTARAPRCEACPVSSVCEARRCGLVDRLPRRRSRRATARVHVAAACAVRGGRALLVRRAEGGVLAGLWEFPSAEGGTAADALRRLRRRLRPLGLVLAAREPAGRARHAILHRRLDIAVFRADPGETEVPPRGDETRWFRRVDLAHAAIPTLTRSIAEAAGFLPNGSSRFLERCEKAR